MLPERLLWPNESNQTAVLYCPYVARGGIRTGPTIESIQSIYILSYTYTVYYIQFYVCSTVTFPGKPVAEVSIAYRITPAEESPTRFFFCGRQFLFLSPLFFLFLFPFLSLYLSIPSLPLALQFPWRALFRNPEARSETSCHYVTF